MLKVLYIEDNEDSAYMLRMRLEMLGDFEVTVAPNGPDGIAKATAILPEVILMDMDLPGLSGTEVMRILKSNPMTASIPIVALTAHAMEGTRKAALEDGFDEYCAKPIDFEELLSVIRTVGGPCARPA